MKRSKSMITWLLVVALPLSVYANVTNITSGGPEYPTFAAAIMAAGQGDTLRGRAAVWNETAFVPGHKHVTIDGGYNASYSAKTGYSVVTNESSSPVFQVMPGAKVYLQSLIIKGGDGSGMVGGGIGALLSTVTVVNCVITNSAAYNGGAIVAAGLVVVSNSQLVGNSAANQGGGVYVRSGARFLTHNTTINLNTAKGGAGIYAQPSETHVEGGSIAMNVASSMDGGGLFAESSAVVRIHNVSVADNTAAQAGGGVYAQFTDLTIRDSSVLGNTAAMFPGGGGIKTEGGTLFISNTVVNGNTSAAFGGGINSDNTDLQMVDATIGTLAAPNVAMFAGSGLRAQFGTVHLRNVLIEGNTGEMVFASGAYILTDKPLWASNVVVRFNRGMSNGGVGWTGNGGIEAYHVYLVSNYATFVGAGNIAAQSNLFISTLRVVGNTSETATAGLSINLWQGTGVIHRAHYQYNRSNNGVGAGTFGGSGADVLTINDLFVADNTGDADDDDVGGSGGLEFWSLRVDVRPVSAPVTITRNKGATRGALFINGSRVAFHAPSPAQSVWITENSAVLTSGVGAVHVEAGWYGATAAFYGAVHVISNVGYHGGIIVTNENYYWNSNQAYFVALPSNGLGARIAFNRSEGPGGGLYVFGEGTLARLHSARLENNFVGFAPALGGGAAIDEGGIAYFINTHFIGNFSSNSGGGVGIRGTGSRAYFDADFATAPSSHLPPTRVFDNYAHLSGGGVAALPGASLYLFNTLVASNRAANTMGGGVLAQAALTHVRNAVIVRNNAGMQGDGLAVFSAPLFSMVNSTVAHNDTNGLFVTGTAPNSFITNSIIWGHGGSGYELVETPTPSTLQNCTVQGGYPGTGILTSDPLFWGVPTMDYQLSASSPSIDAGVTSGVTPDCIGTPRPQGAAYDHGAYEFVPEPAGAVGALVLAWVLRMYAKRAAA